MDISTEHEKQQRYIHFKFTKEQTTPDSLGSEEQFIPALGRISIIISRAFEYKEGEKGIIVKDNRLNYGSAKAFSNSGLYDLGIDITGPRQNVICKIQIPYVPQELVSIAKSIPDDVEKDEFEKYQCLAETWSVGEKNEKLPLFVPNDPNFLSTLGFRFEAQTAIILEP